MKLILLSLFIGIATAESAVTLIQKNSSSNTIAVNSLSASAKESPELIGGWYPVFFNEYSNVKVQEIVDGIKTGKIKRLIISYDENKSLAMQIRTNVQAKVNFAVQMEHVPLTDSSSTQFNHSQVVVTVYTR